MERKAGSEVSLAFGSKQYVIYTDRMNWVEASAYAQYIGGHLATIPDEATNVYLATEMRRLGLTGAWIGLNDEKQEGVWVWQTGSTATYRNWARKEPNNRDRDRRGEDHAVLRSNGEWNDYMGYAHGHAIPFIVELHNT